MIEVGDAFAATPDPDLLRLEQLKRGLQDTFDTLKRLDEELIVHVDAADVNREIEDAERIKDEMFAAMAQVDQAIAARAGRRSSPSAPVPATSVAHNVTKLPKLSIKHFSGSLTGWSIFWDSYFSSSRLL